MKRANNCLFSNNSLISEINPNYDTSSPGISVNLTGLQSSQLAFVGNVFGDLSSEAMDKRGFISRIDLDNNPQMNESVQNENIKNLCSIFNITALLNFSL